MALYNVIKTTHEGQLFLNFFFFYELGNPHTGKTWNFTFPQRNLMSGMVTWPGGIMVIP
jgi:hypothetical protein